MYNELLQFEVSNERLQQTTNYVPKYVEQKSSSSDEPDLSFSYLSYDRIPKRRTWVI